MSSWVVRGFLARAPVAFLTSHSSPGCGLVPVVWGLGFLFLVSIGGSGSPLFV